MNVLVMSIAQKVPMLKAVRRAMKLINENSRLFGADTDANCLGQHFVDCFWHCPPLRDISINLLISFCKANNITVIFPSRDGELAYFAEFRSQLLDQGIHVMISEPAAIELCMDKLLFFKTLSEHGYPVISTSERFDIATERYVVKERFGAGALNAGVNLSRGDAESLLNKLCSPIVQPFVSGTEYSIDLYVNVQGKVQGIVARERRHVVKGESQITSTVRVPDIERLCTSIAERYFFRGHVLLQIIIDQEGNPHIVECNARFGGASTLSLAAGMDSFGWFIRESRGELIEQTAPFMRSIEERTLIRHPEDYIQ
ncbi:ATP-grasp domain-containing protein [Paenibacillus tarimensis]|uniref:ATP-grasp domain-containing protein n=1 Tax=Paenibacillus tarimensis TaxID=416012 RepID=UPI001F203EE2|nr:ATP-grasp domain-containing protein [Paenibacillus tarimensis]MCF2944113.1 ATP-grasp domain-containing protein [Paenibacillus tarimensis]